MRERRMRERRIGNKMSKKLVGLFGLVILALVFLALDITRINAASGQQYKRIVLAQAQQQYDSKTIPFQRGDITDRNGTILATSEKMYNLVLDCQVVNTEQDTDTAKNVKIYKEETVRALVSLFDVSETELRGVLDAEDTRSSQYYVLKKNLTINDKKRFEAYTNPESEENAGLSEAEKNARYYVKGIWFEENYVRKYPLDSQACDLIGFTYDGTTADWGIEGYYSDILNGTNGRQYGYYDTNADVEQTIIQAQAGHNVVSTIDSNVQQIIRNSLEIYETEMAKDKNKTNGADHVGVIVMNPKNGEILGMDSDRWYDLNNPRDLSDFYTEDQIGKMSDAETEEKMFDLWGNFCISSAYEPGSVFKPITAAAGLSTGVFDADTTFTCDGGEQVVDKYIACEGEHGKIKLDDVIKNSCNDALMQMAEKIGEDDFHKYNTTFNFGMRTGIDLPGEGSGLLFSEEVMGPVELATSAFGQGFTCTMIQEISAISAAINGGYYYKPHVVKAITDENGAVVQSIDPILERRTNTEEVSDAVRKSMKAVMDEGGTGHVVKIPGYTMGGKTGTAEKLPRGKGNYVLSFIGFAPLDDPQVVVYVVVDEPNAKNQEPTAFAMSIARNIFTQLLPYMNIFPDEPGYTTENVDKTLCTSAILLGRLYESKDNGVTIFNTGQTLETLTGDIPEIKLAENGMVDTDGDGIGDFDPAYIDRNGNGIKDTEEKGLMGDTTFGTAEDGSDLPHAWETEEQYEDDFEPQYNEETEQEEEYWNDYSSDGISNEDWALYYE